MKKLHTTHIIADLSHNARPHTRKANRSSFIDKLPLCVLIVLLCRIVRLLSFPFQLMEAPSFEASASNEDVSRHRTVFADLMGEEQVILVSLMVNSNRLKTQLMVSHRLLP